jgi:hypothetical protein
MALAGGVVLLGLLPQVLGRLSEGACTLLAAATAGGLG